MTQTVRNRVLLAKVESSYGVDPTPVVATDAIEVRNLSYKALGDLLERDNVRSNISATSPVVGKRWAEITFDAELKGSGTKGTAGALSDLLQACSFAETVSAGSSVTYAPTSSSQKSATFYVYNNDTSSAVLQKITGAVGTFTLKLTAGEYGVLSFTFRGMYNAPTDVALPTTPTFETTTPPTVQSAAFTINSVSSLIIQEVNIDIANTLAEHESVNATNGLSGFFVSERKPKGSFNPEATLLATYDYFTDWASSTSRALSVVIGSVNGNKCTITAPAVTIDSLSDADRNSLLAKDIPISFGQSSGNDEIQFKFE